MFEYNGKTFSLEMLEEKAKAEGISLDELLKANPDIKKIDDSGKSSAVANQAANATAVNEQIAAGQSTDLGSEDISLDL
jgi:DNA polymerase elongation subunit (family B)